MNCSCSSSCGSQWLGAANDPVHYNDRSPVSANIHDFLHSHAGAGITALRYPRFASAIAVSCFAFLFRCCSIWMLLYMIINKNTTVLELFFFTIAVVLSEVPLNGGHWEISMHVIWGDLICVTSVYAVVLTVFCSGEFGFHMEVVTGSLSTTEEWIHTGRWWKVFLFLFINVGDFLFFLVLFVNYYCCTIVYSGTIQFVFIC